MAMEPAPIRRLPDLLARRLRSSCVIASLSQVLEELICNSIDARSSEVKVKFETNTLSLSVEDDGCGMTRDDLLLLGSPHVTSKLSTQHDLDAGPSTLGFKGEALHAIMEMALVDITTRPRGSVHTYRKICKGGEVLSMGMTSQDRRCGTTVRVSEIFFNQPVRRRRISARIMKEAHNMREHFIRLALIRPGVSFVLQDCFQDMCLPSVASAPHRLEQIFGGSFSSVFSKVDYKKKSHRLSGYLSPLRPEDPESRILQYFYVNRRFVSRTPVHRLLQSVFTDKLSVEAMQTSSRSQQRPSFILNLECPLAEYDVTFDPDKTVIEFKDWKPILAFVHDVLNSVWDVPGKSLQGPDSTRKRRPSASSDLDELGMIPKRSRSLKSWQHMDPSYKPSYSTRKSMASEAQQDVPAAGDGEPPEFSAKSSRQRVRFADTLERDKNQITDTPEVARATEGLFLTGGSDLRWTAAELVLVQESPLLAITDGADLSPDLSALSPESCGDALSPSLSHGWHLQPVNDQSSLEQAETSWGGLQRCGNLLRQSTDWQCEEQHTKTGTEATPGDVLEREGQLGTTYPNSRGPSSILQSFGLDHAAGVMTMGADDTGQPLNVLGTLHVQSPTVDNCCEHDYNHVFGADMSKSVATAGTPTPLILDITGSSAMLSAGGAVLSSSVVPMEVSRKTISCARSVAQIEKKFILALAGSVILLIDQHAADERVLLEELWSQTLKSTTPQESELLGVPVHIAVSPEEALCLQNQKTSVEWWGWRFKVMAAASKPPQSLEQDMVKPHDSGWSSSVLVNAVPRIYGSTLGPKHLAEYARELVATQGSAGPPKCALRLLNSKACRGAIMFGDALLPSQCAQLLQQLKSTQLFFQCAHGRPTMVPLVDLNLLHTQLEVKPSQPAPPSDPFSGSWRLAHPSRPSNKSQEGWHGLMKHGACVSRLRRRLSLQKLADDQSE